MKYYSYDKNELMKSSKIPVEVLADTDKLARRMADDIIDVIVNGRIAAQDPGKDRVLIFPVGPVIQYPYLVKRINEERINLHKVWIFNMDEYLKEDQTYIDISDPLSFRGFMNRAFYDLIDETLIMPTEQRVFPDPSCPEKIASLIEELGGVDACFGGIGIDGHVAFNEPENISCEDYLQLSTRVVRLAPESRTTNSINDLNGAIELMPEFAVTVGMREISASQKIRLYCLRDWHRAVVRRACFGEKSSRFPVTLLQDHNDTQIITNDIAAQAAVLQI